ncbi:hypothetical protein BDC45DRAFT_502562 [Circinella umbellata]|nr:hypothetical protein BDC45DRAFT_502562 [Circinella umbellata]
MNVFFFVLIGLDLQVWVLTLFLKDEQDEVGRSFKVHITMRRLLSFYFWSTGFLHDFTEFYKMHIVFFVLFPNYT